MRERRYAPLGVTTDHETRILALEAGGTEVNDLTAAVTWANVPDANITQSSVTQHEAALTLTEAQVEAALSAATAFTVGNYVFNVDQTVGAGQDNYVLTYDNGTGEIGLEAAAGGGATQLTDLSDVNTATVTNRNVLVADGVDFESRALVEADISDLGTYLTASDVKWTNVSEDVNDTIDSQYMQGVAFKDGTSTITYTLEASGVTTFAVGATCAFINANATGNIAVNEGTGTTLYLLDGSAITDTAGGCTIAGGGYATLYRHSATVYYIMGAGITA